MHHYLQRFASDGKELPCQNKSDLLTLLESSATIPEDADEPDASGNSPRQQLVAIMDGMAIVHAAPFRHDNGKTCEDLAEAFLAVVTPTSRGYDAVHVIFDHYDKGISPKQQTRDFMCT